MNRISTRQKVKDLKTKMSNLELEVRALISGAEFEPGIIDAIHNDVSEFTDEIKKIKKELENIKNSKNLKEDHLDLMNIYEGLIKENNPHTEEKIQGKTGNEWLELIKTIPIEELLEWADLSQHQNFYSLLFSIANKIKKI